MSGPARRRGAIRAGAAITVLAAVTLVMARWRPDFAGAWPPVVALLVILLFRHALWGLLAGGLAGAIILHQGQVFTAAVQFIPEHLWPGLTSPWKIGAVAFTFLLGGFAAILEAGGGFTALLHRFSRGSDSDPRALETAAAGLGILCFFDGLANSMVVGRVSRDLADRTGTARVKLAYITDSTSSAVACVAVISTWIAFQLSMIEAAFAQAGKEVNPYAVFLHSLPLNFYCWFTLVMLWVAIRRRFHPGPMAGLVAEAELAARDRKDAPAAALPPAASALVPLAVLIASFLAGFLVLGSEGPLLPLTRDGIVAAFGSDAGPAVMVLAAGIASVAAALMLPGPWTGKPGRAAAAFGRGVAAMFLPILILLAAWILGSVISQLNTAGWIAGLAMQGGSLDLAPALVFITGALVSFATGTSWGTMGLLFPLTVPAAAALGAADGQLHLVVAAVFSGAVFGDHCSPISDTTIVTSISCGVEPHDHVRTQLPYALLTAAAAVLLGFLPAGFGVPGWALLPLGAGLILLFPRLKKFA